MFKASRWIGVTIFLLGGVIALALNIPPLSSPVVDQAHIISRTTRGQLAEKLKAVQSANGPQIQVLTLNSLEGLTIEQAAIQIVDKWQLGDRDRDDGVLLLIVPSERKVRIEVGQGLEGQLPDIFASRIIRDVIVPQFRANNFDRGIVMGVQYILQAVKPEANQLPLRELGQDTQEDHRDISVTMMIIVLYVFFFLASALRAARRPGWSRSSSGMGGIGTGWRGGRSGGFGGGWSGGGGGFSGGGASGNW